jgi:glucose/arabinose dehydrogenase
MNERRKKPASGKRRRPATRAKSRRSGAAGGSAKSVTRKSTARRRPSRQSKPADWLDRTRIWATAAAVNLRSPNRKQLEVFGLILLVVILGITGIVVRATRESGTKVMALEKVGSFDQPVGIVQPPGRSQLVVVEKAGQLRVLDDGVTLAKPMLDLRKLVKTSGRGGEQGMLSVAFPGDFTKSGRYYVSFTDRHDDLRIFEYRVEKTGELVTEPGSGREILTVPQPTTQHHSGHLEFGPDGFLYIGSGDGGPSGDPANVSQDRRSLLGKLLRIDPSRTTGRKGTRNWRAYLTPKSNPYVGVPGRDEIYSLGLRNPWSFTFDRSTGALIVGDVGNSRFEEVNYLPAGGGLGANFGWAAYEGTAVFKGGVARARTVTPAVVYPHGPACSVIGGYAVRDPRLSRIAGPEVVGSVVFGDFCTGKVYAFVPRFGPAKKVQSLRFRIRGLAGFGQDRAGRIYLISLEGGIWRLTSKRKD